jgi:Uma2 family endonuclease
MVISEKTYTLAEFKDYAAQHPDRVVELINGRIVEEVTTEEHGIIAANIVGELRIWKKSHNIKGYYSVETSVELADDDKNFRQPDVCFRFTDEAASTKSTLDTVPDFCAEVRSPTNSPKELREKAEYFIANGARLVWLVHPRSRAVEVYYADGSYDIFTEENVLSGGDVLPGFEMLVRDIFDF